MLCVCLVGLVPAHEKRCLCLHVYKDTGSWPSASLRLTPHRPHSSPSTASGPRGNKQNNLPDLRDTKPSAQRSFLSGMTRISFSLLSLYKSEPCREKVYWLWTLPTGTSQASRSKLSEAKSRSILFIFLRGGVLSTGTFMWPRRLTTRVACCCKNVLF